MKMQLRRELDLLVLLALITAGQCIVTSVDPPNGTTLADFEGAVNSTTIICNVEDSIERLITSWFIRDEEGNLNQILSDDPEFVITGDPTPELVFNITGIPTYRNRITILNFTEELDGLTLACGSGVDPDSVTYPLRIYREPSLRDNLQINILEGRGNVSVDLSNSPPAFPFPAIFQWQRDGVSMTDNSSTIAYGYPSIIFSNVSRTDSGSYSLTAMNFLLNDSNSVLGNDTGSFNLNVLHGPTLMEPGSTSFGALEGDNVTLLCGTNLQSNPEPSLIEWRQEDTVIDVANERYIVNNGPDSVSLTIVNVTARDSGNWSCGIQVEFNETNVDGSSVVSMRELVQDLTLTILVPPSSPMNLTVNASGPTSVLLSWLAPEFPGQPSFSVFDITATPTDNPASFKDPVPLTVTMSFQILDMAEDYGANMSGLLPNVEYEFTVSAVSVIESTRAISEASEEVTTLTHTTVPGIMCSQVPASQNGDIFVQWEYVHLGGQNITGVLASYDIEKVDGTVMRLSDGQLNDVTSFEFPGLTAGLSYTFFVTATNANGSAEVECPPVEHLIGIPLAPSIVSADTDIPGRIILSVQTSESGTPDTPSMFSFIVVAIEIASGNTSIVTARFDDYSDNAIVDVTIRGLVGGRSYQVRVTARNQFGDSEASNPQMVRVREDVGSTSSNVGAIVGGIIGGVAAVVAIVILIIIIVVVFRTCRNKSSHKMNLSKYSYGSHEMVSNDLYAKSGSPKIIEEGVIPSDPNYETVPVTKSLSSSKHSLYDSLPPAPTPAKADNPLYSSTGELHRLSMNLDATPQPSQSQSLEDLTTKSDSAEIQRSESNNEITKKEQTDGAWYATVPTPVSLASRSSASLGIDDPPPPQNVGGTEEHVYTEL